MEPITFPCPSNRRVSVASDAVWKPVVEIRVTSLGQIRLNCLKCSAQRLSISCLPWIGSPFLLDIVLLTGFCRPSMSHISLSFLRLKLLPLPFFTGYLDPPIFTIAFKALCNLASVYFLADDEMLSGNRAVFLLQSRLEKSYCNNICHKRNTACTSSNDIYNFCLRGLYGFHHSSSDHKTTVIT